MKVTITNRQLEGAVHAMNLIMPERMGARLAYRLGYNAKKFNGALDTLNMARLKLGEENAARFPEGHPQAGEKVPAEDAEGKIIEGAFKVRDVAAFNNDLDLLLKESFEIELRALPLPWMEHMNFMTPVIMASLDFVIIEEDEQPAKAAA